MQSVKAAHDALAAIKDVQWIPRSQEGLPIIEGLFTQALAGDAAEFVGAEPSNLPEALEHRIVWEATCLACYLQNLGYFGRCGFDTILIGDSFRNASVHWIECNGRWGGVSIPTTVANCLLGDRSRKFIVIVQRTQLNMPPHSLEHILTLLKEHLFRAGQSLEGLVLLSPGLLIDGGGLNLMVIGDSKPRAQAHLEAAINLLRCGAPLPVSEPCPS